MAVTPAASTDTFSQPAARSPAASDSFHPLGPADGSAEPRYAVPRGASTRTTSAAGTPRAARSGQAPVTTRLTRLSAYGSRPPAASTSADTVPYTPAARRASRTRSHAPRSARRQWTVNGPCRAMARARSASARPRMTHRPPAAPLVRTRRAAVSIVSADGPASAPAAAVTQPHTRAAANRTRARGRPNVRVCMVPPLRLLRAGPLGDLLAREGRAIDLHLVDKAVERAFAAAATRPGTPILIARTAAPIAFGILSAPKRCVMVPHVYHRRGRHSRAEPAGAGRSRRRNRQRPRGREAPRAANRSTARASARGRGRT